MHDAGEAFVIWPPEPVTVSDVEHDPQKLLDLYAQGYETAARAWPALMRYLEA
jgi:predicted patatin/cPLA2 family phospholipase